MKNKIKFRFKYIYLWITTIILLIVSFILIFVISNIFKNFPLLGIVSLSVLVGFSFIAMIILGFLTYQNYKNNVIVKSTLNQYIEQEIAKEGVGIFVFNERLKIIWVSHFIKERFGNKIIGKNLDTVFNVETLSKKNFKTTTKYNDFFYEINFLPEKNILMVRDVTSLQNITTLYESEKTVFGEIDIDSMDLYQSIYSEEEIFKIYNSVVKVLDDLSKTYDFVYRRFINNRFFLITTKQTLQNFIANNFRFFTTINSEDINGKTFRIPLSVGFASGMEKLDELTETTKDALSQSQSRGGDQVTVILKNQKPLYFGSKSEIALNSSRTKISFIAKALKEKLNSQDISKVIIYGHKEADLDALGSAYALATIVRAKNKKAYIQNTTFDATCKKQKDKYLKNDNSLFISPKQATKLNDESTMVIIVDTADINRIENPNAFKNINPENVFVLDHHRISKLPEFVLKQNLYIDTTASSASEIVTEILVFSQNNQYITLQSAQMLLDGIYMDTNRFQKTSSSKTFNAVSLLEEWGASSSTSIETLKMTKEVHQTVSKILENLQEVKQDYFIAAYDKEVDSDIIAIAAEEILRIQGRKAAFVIAKIPGSNKYKMSARGINTNVQIIAEAMNGGGHFGAAASVSDTESLEVFVDNLIQAIVSIKDESNIN
ncbi:DHH family phosphoesterase [Mycoplasma zalophi]|uniref:DHH family phosphoesterase n=1 Tax=Mycoplasma zalophi TaxID=191287 RepID=UPI001C10C82E|nr:DHH family phosphoesterase [Mycoplasma zalophi]MBU4691199.1 DHH family phosphoesterase [Mycoplasma zalophi]